jgi:hypothetical protein
MRTVISLRKTRPFIPKGVHRFKSFNEANQWAIQMMARKKMNPPSPQGYGGRENAE